MRRKPTAVRVVVTAYVTAHQRVDADVEKIVGRLSLEPAVSGARWQVETGVDLEDRDRIARTILRPD